MLQERNGRFDLGSGAAFVGAASDVRFEGICCLPAGGAPRTELAKQRTCTGGPSHFTIC